jgi:16S rRNA (guanine527-N7)-methyltransferase
VSILYQHAREFGLDLTESQQEAFDRYYRLLVEWNERFNLTAITGYTEVQLKHFVDSLSAAPILMGMGAEGRTLVDIGAGAGFPGLPLALAIPDLRVTLVEATGKKVRFLDQVVRELGIENVTTLHARAEELAGKGTYRAMFDYAVARAVAPLRTLAEYALAFVRVGGLFIAYKAVEAEAEAREARRGIELLGGKLREVTPVRLGTRDDVRHLVVVDKIGPTPKIYPRSGGLPRSKPL